MWALAVLLDAIETREDQPSKDRLALTPFVGECEELDRVTVRGYVSLCVCGGVWLRGLLAAAPPSTVLAFVRSGNMLDGRVVGFSSLLLVVLLVSVECPLEWLRVFLCDRSCYCWCNVICFTPRLRPVLSAVRGRWGALWVWRGSRVWFARFWRWRASS